MDKKEEKIAQAIEMIEENGFSAGVIENIIFVARHNMPLAWIMTDFRGKSLKLLVKEAIDRANKLLSVMPQVADFITVIQTVKNIEYRKRIDSERQIENDVLNQCVNFPSSYSDAINCVMNGGGYTINGKKLRFIRNAKKRKFVFRNVINTLCDKYGVN